MSHSWIPLLNLTSRRFTVRRIRVTEEKTDGKDPPLETEDQMKDIDQTLEIEAEEKEALRNLPGNLHATTQRAEVTDPLPRGILLVKVTEGEIMREKVTGTLLEMVEADHNQQTGTEIHPSLATEDPPTALVTAIIVGMIKRKIGTEVEKEMFPKRGKEAEKEVIVEEGVDRLRKVKIVTVSALDVVQPITGPPNAQFTNHAHPLPVLIASWTTKHPNAKPLKSATQIMPRFWLNLHKNSSKTSLKHRSSSFNTSKFQVQ